MARAGVGPLGVLPVRERADILLGKSTGDVAAADTALTIPSATCTRFLKKAWRGHKQLTTVLNLVHSGVMGLRAHMQLEMGSAGRRELLIAVLDL